MYQKFFLTLFALSTLIFSTSAFENRVSGARSAALGNATVADSHPESLLQNTAGLGFLHRMTALLVYESRYSVKEYSQMTAGILIPAGRYGNWGFSICQFGSGEYREYKLGLQYARTFGQKWSAGMQFDRLSVWFPENISPSKAITMEGGLIYRPDEKLHIGIHLFNLFQSPFVIHAAKIPLPWSFRIGESWNIAHGLVWSVEMEKVQLQPAVMKSGIEFMPQPGFFLRSGFTGRPFYPSFGTGFLIRRIMVDMAFSYHGHLGFSPIVGLNYSL